MLKKYLLILGAVVVLIATCVSVSAVTDSSDDLFHYTIDSESSSGYSFERYSGDKPNIDITDLSYTITGSEVSITLTVAGVIEDKAGLAYYVYIPHDTVQMGGLAYYTNGMYYIWGDNQSNANMDMTSHAGSNILTFTINYDDPDGITDVWGYTYEVADVQASTSGEYWGDWAPDTYFSAYDQFYGDDSEDSDADEENADTGTEDVDTGETNTSSSDNGDEDDNNTPGFGIILLIAAISIAIIIIKRKK